MQPAPYSHELIFKVTSRELWTAAENEGQFAGAPIDLQDGYIHFSAAHQLAETLAKHFAGQNDLLLIAILPTSLGEKLRWEPSRDGDLFPHLYETLDTDTVEWVRELTLDDSGVHVLPSDLTNNDA